MHAVLYDWPFVGLALGVLALVAMFVRPSPAGEPYRARFYDPAWLLWLVGPVYLLHQFEEHGVDALGRRYQFLAEICATLGHPTQDACPADPWFIFLVNVPLIWVAAPVASWLGPRRVMAGAFMFSVPLVNAVAHIAGALRHGAYNPGVVTSVLLFVPACAWVFTQLHRRGLITGRRMAAVVAVGVALHAVLMGSLRLVELGVIGKGALYVIQVLNAAMPVVVGLLTPNERRVGEPG